MLIDQVSTTTNQVLRVETYRTKEEVPSPYVDKMNMLSFVEPKQPVRDVGVRWDDEKTVGLYLIVKGDIITDS